MKVLPGGRKRRECGAEGCGAAEEKGQVIPYECYLTCGDASRAAVGCGEGSETGEVGSRGRPLRGGRVEGRRVR